MISKELNMNLNITIGDERGYTVVDTTPTRLSVDVPIQAVRIIQDLLMYRPRRGDTVESRVDGIDYIVTVK